MCWREVMEVMEVLEVREVREVRDTRGARLMGYWLGLHEVTRGMLLYYCTYNSTYIQQCK